MNTRQLSLPIQGMFCAKCAVQIERALVQLDGVVTAHVNYATERATVLYDAGRVRPGAFVRAVQHTGFAVPLQSLTLDVNELWYATSAQTIEQALAREECIVDLSVDWRAAQIRLNVLPEAPVPEGFRGPLQGLGLRLERIDQSAERFEFLLRVVLTVAFALIVDWGAAKHLGLLASSTPYHQPPILALLTAIALVVLGWPFFRRSGLALSKGHLDTAIVIALMASLALAGGLILALISPESQLSAGLELFASTLTAGWFVARALRVGLVQFIRPRPVPDSPILEGLAAKRTTPHDSSH